MKFFLKKSHTNLSFIPHSIVLSMMIFVFIIVLLIKNNELPMFLTAIFVISIIVTYLIYRSEATTGLYINDASVFYKSCIKKININVNEIAGIKILPSYGWKQYGGYYRLKDSDKRLLYSAFILKELNDEIVAYERGDIWFINNFKDHIICSVIYEKNGIDFLKNMNPEIKIFETQED